MKSTMDYMIGNTAVQFINTGKKIKIVDVEKEKKKKRFITKLITTLFIGGILLMSCFYVVRLQNIQLILDEQVYSLQGQIDELQRENNVLDKNLEDNEIDYDAVFSKAKEMGMVFPTYSQMYNYDVQKSTAVRIVSRKMTE